MDFGSECDLESVSDCPSSTKKHKKHKHKKHKKKSKTKEDSSTAPLKLKIRIGNQMVGTKSVIIPREDDYDDEEDEDEHDDADDDDDDDDDLYDMHEFSKSPESPGFCEDAEWTEHGRNGRIMTDSEDEEEEAWLEAVEDGRLDEYEASRNTFSRGKPLTARQRSLQQMKDRDDVLFSDEDTGRKTREQVEKIRLRQQKQCLEDKLRKERAKVSTMDRLLTKQESDASIAADRASEKALARAANARLHYKKVTYVNSARTGISVSFPVGMSFPLKKRAAPAAPKRKICGVPGCNNAKKYSCSKTKVPLCSIECYKKNAACAGQTQLKQAAVT